MRLKRTLSLQNRPTPVGRITGHYQPGAAAAHQMPHPPSRTGARGNRAPHPANGNRHRQKKPTKDSGANNWMLKSAPTATP
jgi:hypothetical protein